MENSSSSMNNSENPNNMIFKG